MFQDLSIFAPIAITLLLSLCLTPVVMTLAHRVGMVAQPKADRWHSKPTAMLGGLAIFSASTVGFLLAHPTSEMWLVFGASAGMCVLGLVDDILHIKPYQKLVVQILAAAIVVWGGLVLPWTASVTGNMLITMFWLIGITNALNLLDNMDGLAAGIAIIASVFLGLTLLSNGQRVEAVTVLSFAAALLGFLFYNFDPAKVFMGDCGSLFVGFFLATSALMSNANSGARTRGLLPVLAVPILIFAIPIFDTTFVTVMRKLSGRSASQGGRDHTSHRLVALGMRERSAVLMLYLFAALAGLVALVARHMDADVSIALITAFVVALTLGGVQLAGVAVYTEEMLGNRNAVLHSFLLDLSYKRRVFEVLLDLVLVVLAYYLSHLLLFGPFNAHQRDWSVFIDTAPVVMGSMMVSMLAVGVYRGVWRYTGLTDLIVIIKSVIAGSLLSVIVVGLVFHFDGFSRAVFALNAMFLTAGIVGTRLSFRFIKRRRSHDNPEAERRVIIYGAGDAGERVLRELLHNSDTPYVPVAFLDDDVRKQGRFIHGLPVYSGEGIVAHCRKLGVDEVVISSPRIEALRVNTLWSQCVHHAITLTKVSLHFEKVVGFSQSTFADQPGHIGALRASGESRRASRIELMIEPRGD